MKLETVYRAAIISGALAYILFWFMPYTYGYFDGEIQAILSYTGYASIISFNETTGWLLFFMFLACSFGMFFYRKIFRTAFLMLIIFTTTLIPLLGLAVMTSVDTLFINITNIMDGVALAMAYFSPIKDKFY